MGRHLRLSDASVTGPKEEIHVCTGLSSWHLRWNNSTWYCANFSVLHDFCYYFAQFHNELAYSDSKYTTRRRKRTVNAQAHKEEDRRRKTTVKEARGTLVRYRRRKGLTNPKMKTTFDHQFIYIREDEQDNDRRVTHVLRGVDISNAGKGAASKKRRHETQHERGQKKPRSRLQHRHREGLHLRTEAEIDCHADFNNPSRSCVILRDYTM